MTFLPIVARELRVAARRRGTYWSRTIMAVGAIIVGTITFIEASNSNSQSYQIAQEMFSVLSVMAFIYCLCVGVRSTADCLSEEKREGTLGLLFLTDLKGYDVIGGKPLHYRRTDDGKFSLYSIGWNETDDGGQIGLTESGYTDTTKGDWVWPNP